MITVNHDASFITGSLNGKSYAIPYKEDWYQRLDAKAKIANAATSPSYSKELHTSFQNSLNAMKGASKANKTAIVEDAKLGNSTLSIEAKPEGDQSQLYLFNGKAYSKFYLPLGLVNRIQTNKSKGLSVDPEIKFFVRANRGKVMTQDKLGRLVDYINKTYVDREIVQDLLDQGYSAEIATITATVLQVPLTMEGLLNTYKVSTLIGESDDKITNSEFDEDAMFQDLSSVLEVVTEVVAVDITEFKFVPTRNSKGHFLKRGSDEYVAEYNRQLENFKSNLAEGQIATVKYAVTTKVKGEVTTTQVLTKEAKAKVAEDYVFQPAYQGNHGDAFFCGEELGHTIKVGKLHKLPHWSQVDTDDSTSARPGLHVGGRDYIRGYENNNWSNSGVKIVHNVFVDPQYVGAVVSVEMGDGAMRVKEYFVHSSFIGINGATYNSSDYAKLTDEEWDAQLTEALATVANVDQQIATLEKLKVGAQSIVDNAF